MDLAETISFTPSSDEEKLRLDVLLTKRFPEQSRSYFHKLFEKGEIFINGSPAKKRLFVTPKDTIQVHFSLLEEMDLTPENIPLDLLFEDEELLVLNKPPGLVMHPAPGNWTGTLVHALLFHFQDLSLPGEKHRPGLVHRLDKDTSGVLVVAKTPSSHRKLVASFAERKVQKNYKALCVGKPLQEELSCQLGRHPTKRKMQCILPEGKGRYSETRFSIDCYNEQFSFVSAYPLTGRTHQIRVHLKELRAPILGDLTYGSSSMNQKYPSVRMQLHAEKLSFPHPVSGEQLSFTAEIPEDMHKLKNSLFPQTKG